MSTLAIKAVMTLHILRNVNDAKNKAIALLTEKMSKYAKGGKMASKPFQKK
jgi:hypothetical protein